MAEPALALASVTAGYGATHVLRGLTLSVAPGERLAVLGRNGTGKTTLLRAVMGLARLHSGRIALDGRDIGRLPPFRRAGLGLGLVPQTRDVFASLSVEENLLAGGPPARLDAAYALFPRLRARRSHGGGQLSGGEQQMLSIARALMGAPRVLLLDEPLEGLAPALRADVMAAVERLAREGRTVVLVEQQADLALRFADRAVILEAGRIVHDGPAAALRSDQGRLERHLGLGGFGGAGSR